MVQGHHRPQDRQAAASNFDDDDDGGGVTIIVAIVLPSNRDGPRRSPGGMRHRDCRCDDQTAESSAGHRAATTG
jgi:hypothetical protein